MNIAKLKKFVVDKLTNELPEQLTYHDVTHTLGVLDVCQQYIRRLQIPEHDAYLLRTAALIHDAGYLRQFDNHETESVHYAREILPAWNYSEIEIQKIVGMILATKVPQKPHTLLEQIIGDSDLDYLGTKAFYKRSFKLYIEMVNRKLVSDPVEWDRLQVEFLRVHHYHTSFAKKYREPVKQKYLKEILDKHGWT